MTTSRSKKPRSKYELSASRINCFATCRRKYFLRYVEKLVPLHGSQIMNEGSLFHEGAAFLFDLKRSVESTGGQEPEFGVVAAHVANRAAEFDLDAYSTAAVIETLGVMVRSPIYARLKITHTEQHVRTKIGATHLQGYFDAVGTVDTDTGPVPVIVELKRRKQIPERVVQHTAFQYQPALYSLIARDLGIENAGVLYLNMRACSLTPKLATPEGEIKYKKNGEPYAWVRLEDETVAEYRERVREWYNENEAIVVHLDRRTNAQMDETASTVDTVRRDIVSATRRGAFYRNPNACSIMPCEYASVCLEDTPELREGCFSCTAHKPKQAQEGGSW